MSLNVLVIPEDRTFNGYILKPLMKAVAADAGRPNANVLVLPNPHLTGYDEARTAIRGKELDGKYKHYDLWIFMPDADRAKLDSMSNMEALLKTRGIRLLCCPAQPEVEIYACVAYRKEFNWRAAR